MHVSSGTALVVTALIASLMLLLGRSERVFSIVAVLASGLEALLAFDIITFSVKKLRIDVVLPALLVVAGAVCWSRLSTKGQVTAATTVALVGLLQLLSAIDVLR
jgi:hypothetical protein